MSELKVIRPPELIAAEINGIWNTAKMIFLQSCIEVGRLLVEAKEQLPHGEWGDWLTESVDYSQSTANNLMRLYREYGVADSQSLGNLSYTQAIALLAVPAEEREQFVQENDAGNKSAKQLQQAIKEKQLLEDKLKKSEALAKELKEQKKAHDELVQRLSTQLKEAQAAGDQEAVNRAQASLEEAQTEINNSRNRIKELEDELKKKPIDVPAVVEKIPEETEQELVELRLKVSQQQGSESVIKFKVRFEALVGGFKDLLGALDGVTDPEELAKCKGAVSGLIGKMSERM